MATSFASGSLHHLCRAARCPEISSRIRSLTPAFCRTGKSGYMVGGRVRQSYAGVDFISQLGIYEFGYWVVSHRWQGGMEHFPQMTKKNHLHAAF
jgi:hypothetical protein